MEFRLPRLPRAVAIVGKDGWPAQTFQQWWQSVAVALEAAIRTLQGVLDNLTDIFVELGLIEVKADGALALAGSAINPDGTIKNDRVLTESVLAGAITASQAVTSANTDITYGSGSVPFIETGWIDVGDADFSSAVANLNFTMNADLTNQYDASALFRLYVDLNDGAGFVMRSSQTLGVATNSGDTYSRVGAQLQAVIAVPQFRLRAEAQTGSYIQESANRNIRVEDIVLTVLGTKR